MWLTFYDMKKADQDDESGLQPGFYYITDVLYGDLDWLFAFYDGDNGEQDFAFKDGRSQQYMVTDNGFFLRCIEERYSYFTSITQDGDKMVATVSTESGPFGVKNASSEDYTTVIQVDWNWQESGKNDDLWSKLSSQERDEYREHMGLETLLEEKDYLYQPLDENHCLIQTGSGLYTNVYLIGQSKGQLHYIYQLIKGSDNG